MLNVSKIQRRLRKMKKLDFPMQKINIVKYPTKENKFFKVECLFSGGILEGYGEDVPQALDNLFEDYIVQGIKFEK